MAGRRWRRVSSARTCTFGAISGDDSRTIAPTPRWFAIKKAASKSEARCISTTSNWTFSVLAALRTESNCTDPVSGSHSTAACESFGLLSISISIHFAVKSGKSRNTPVMLPPGRARAAATPLATGSVSKSIATIGTVRVADRAARSTGGPLAMITRTFFAMTSATSGAIFSGAPSARPGHNPDLGGTGVAGNSQTAQDRLDPKSHRRLGALIYKTDSGDFRRLLCTRRERPHDRCATDKDDKFAPPHWCPRG